jgi:hypothetical protein
MPARSPGQTFAATFTKLSGHNHPAVELNHAGIAQKSQQIPPGVPSNAAAAAAKVIEIGEEAVIDMNGSHTFESSFLPGGAAAGSRLWINPADNTLSLSASPGAVNPAVSVKVDATGGTLTITIDGEVSGAIAPTVTAAELRAKLEAMSNIGAGDVTVAGGPGNAGGTTPYIITFVKGRYAGAPKPAITTQVGALTGGAGTAAVADAVVGVAGAEGVKFGVVDEIDTVSVPNLVTVNLSQRSSF